MAFLLAIFLTFFVMLNSYGKEKETSPEEEKVLFR
jgi:hypothetical protein